MFTFDFLGNYDAALEFALNAELYSYVGSYYLKKGDLKGYFTLHDIIMTKQELNEIWKN